MSILFSIIIPTYNRSALLERALKSIFDQKVEGTFEVIIVDDGSSDDTEKIVKQQSFLNIFYFYQENQGQSSARNSGVAKANGAFNMCALVSLCIPYEYLKENHSPVGFPHWQDTHLILRLFAKYPLVQIDSYTYVYVIHQKMGSLKNETKNTILERARIYVAAIEDFFLKYDVLVTHLLPTATFEFLKAEKYIEYANLELVVGNRKHHWVLLKKSMQSKIDVRLWKHYILFVKYLILGS